MPNKAEFAEWIEAARAVTVQQELMRRGLWSRAMGGDRGVPCPGCAGRDRFAVNVRKNVWNCRASGEAGDAIALARHIDGSGFLAAVETVNGAPPGPAAGLAESELAAIAARAENAAREDEAKRRDQEKTSARFRERERRAAFDIWRAAAPIAGTPAEEYLSLRGLPRRPARGCGFIRRCHFLTCRKNAAAR